MKVSTLDVLHSKKLEFAEDMRKRKCTIRNSGEPSTKKKEISSSVIAMNIICT